MQIARTQTRRGFGSFLLALGDSAVRPLRGHDVFVSYSRRNAPYAFALANAVEGHGYVVFLDLLVSHAGVELPPALRRALRRSSTLVIVETHASLTSRNVSLEVEEFSQFGRPVIRVLAGVAVNTARWASMLEAALVANESEEALALASPSSDVVRDIERGVRFPRARAKLVLLAVSALLAVGVALWLTERARSAASDATRAETRARAEQEQFRRLEDLASAALSEAETKLREAIGAKETAASEVLRGKKLIDRYKQSLDAIGATFSRKNDPKKKLPSTVDLKSSRADGATTCTYKVVPALPMEPKTELAVYRTEGMTMSVSAAPFSLVYQGQCFHNGTALFLRADGSVVAGAFNICASAGKCPMPVP